MTICTRSTPGQLYLLHFSAKLGDPANPHGWAQHYLGWALDAEVRIALHLVGQSDVKIVQAALRQGLVITPHILGNAVKGAERAIKRRKQNLARYCPICTACPKPLPAGLFQLALPFDEDDDPDWDFDQVPDPPGLTEWDGYRIAWERRRHAPTCLLLSGTLTISGRFARKTRKELLCTHLTSLRFCWTMAATPGLPSTIWTMTPWPPWKTPCMPLRWRS